MSLQSEIITALDGIASGKVYPQAAPADVDVPFVIYRVSSKTPVNLLSGDAGIENSTVIFECYGDKYTDSLTLAGEVRTAIEASDLTQYRVSSPGEDYIEPVDEFMEPVFYGFWYP